MMTFILRTCWSCPHLCHPNKSWFITVLGDASSQRICGLNKSTVSPIKGYNKLIDMGHCVRCKAINCNY